jgi:hypothetical protein
MTYAIGDLAGFFEIIIEGHKTLECAYNSPTTRLPFFTSLEDFIPLHSIIRFVPDNFFRILRRKHEIILYGRPFRGPRFIEANKLPRILFTKLKIYGSSSRSVEISMS